MAGDADGVLGIDYARGRESRRALRYRLWRRTVEVARVLSTYGPRPLTSILDLGAAEGRMLEALHKAFPAARCAGIEYSADLVAAARAARPDLDIIQGDVQVLPCPDASFDAVTAAAVIEHVNDPARVFREAARVLRPGGILAVTSPHPFWERLATRVGHLSGDQHQHVLNLEALSALARDAGLEVVEAERFMLSPVGMPFEFAAEKVARALALRCLMANQVLAARKTR